MKRDFGLIFHVFLIFGDACAVLLSFLVAYLVRTYLDQRPFYFESAPVEFASSMLFLLPVYIIVLAAFGLYSKSIFLNHNRWSEIGRLFLASIVGMMSIITYDFFFQVDLFPVRTMAFYAVLSCFFFLCIFRGVVRAISRLTELLSVPSLSAIARIPNT